MFPLATSSSFSFSFRARRFHRRNSTVGKRKKLNLFLPSLLPSLPTLTPKKKKKQTASQLAPPPPAPRRRNAALGAPRSPKPKRKQQDEPVRRSGRLDGKPPRCYSEDPALPANREVRKLKGGSGSRSIRERGERGEFGGGEVEEGERKERERERLTTRGNKQTKTPEKN